MKIKLNHPMKLLWNKEWDKIMKIDNIRMSRMRKTFHNLISKTNLKK